MKNDRTRTSVVSKVCRGIVQSVKSVEGSESAPTADAVANAERNVVRVDSTSVQTSRCACFFLSCAWSMIARWRSQLIVRVRTQMSFSRS
eukprot:scaffold9067_cov60-Phaeocystis_antarctica.AAC.3